MLGKISGPSCRISSSFRRLWSKFAKHGVPKGPGQIGHLKDYVDAAGNKTRAASGRACIEHTSGAITPNPASTLAERGKWTPRSPSANDAGRSLSTNRPRRRSNGRGPCVRPRRLTPFVSTLDDIARSWGRQRLSCSLSLLHAAWKGCGRESRRKGCATDDRNKIAAAIFYAWRRATGIRSSSKRLGRPKSQLPPDFACLRKTTDQI